MTELLSKPIENDSDIDTAPASQSAEDIETIHSETNEAPTGTREVSPTGSKLVRAAERINEIFEKRAIEKAHGAALAEDKARTISAQEDAFASYEENIGRSADIDDAYKMNDKYDRGVARAEKIENAKEKVRGLGRSILTHMKNAGLISLGLGVMGAEAASRGVKTRANAFKQRRVVNKAHKEALLEDRERTISQQEDAFASYEDNFKRSAEIDEAYKQNDIFNKEQAKKQAIIDGAHEKALKMNERFDRIRERKAAAEERKAARRAKWTERRESTVGYLREVKDAMVDQQESAKRATKEKFIRLGRSAMNTAERAKLSGQAAVDTWKNYPN